MDDIKVSIIIPTYNRAYILGKAIDSVIKQNHKNWELLIVDDGSTDKTEDLIRGLKNQRVKYYSQTNKGPSAARNLGLDNASGQYIAYLDSDNDFLSDYLSTMLAHFKEDPKAKFAIPRLNYTLEQYKGAELVKSIDYSENIPLNISTLDIVNRTFHFDTNGLIHTRHAIKDKIRWDYNVRVMEDWDFALSLCEAYPDGFMFVPLALANYKQRYGRDGMVGSVTYQKIADGFERIYQNHKNDKIMRKQSWYPSRVERWQKMQKLFEEGKVPPHSEYYFSELFSKTNPK